MTTIRIAQRREVSAADTKLIRALMVAHSTWGRTALSGELCRLWDWCNPRGQLKDMAARAFLLKLERNLNVNEKSTNVSELWSAQALYKNAPLLSLSSPPSTRVFAENRSLPFYPPRANVPRTQADGMPD